MQLQLLTKKLSNKLTRYRFLFDDLRNKKITVKKLFCYFFIQMDRFDINKLISHT